MSGPALRTMRRRAAFVLGVGLAAAIPRAARASDSVTLEAGGGESKPTPAIQASAFEYQRIVGRYEPSDSIYMSAGIRLTHDFQASRTPGTRLRSGPDWVWAGTFDFTDDVSKHVTLGAGLSGSPPSTRTLASPFSFPVDAATSTSATAALRTTSANVGASVDIAYDTADDDEDPRAVDGSVDLSLGYTHFATDQAMTAVDGPGGVMSIGALTQTCAGKSTPLCQVAAQGASSARGTLEQLRLGATFTATLYETTDAALDVAYYVYDQNPDAVGYFNVATSDASGRSIGSASYGAGLPLLPTRASVRPELGHKWDKVSLRAWYQLSDYTAPGFIGHAVGAKAQVSFDKWKVYATGSYRADLLTTETATTWTLGLGLTRVF